MQRLIRSAVVLLALSSICIASSGGALSDITIPYAAERFVIPDFEDGSRIGALPGDIVYVSRDSDNRGIVVQVERDTSKTKWLLRVSGRVDTSNVTSAFFSDNTIVGVEISEGLRNALRSLFVRLTYDARYGFVLFSTGEHEFQQYLKVDVPVRGSMVGFSDGVNKGSVVDEMMKFVEALGRMHRNGNIDESTVMAGVERVLAAKARAPTPVIAIDGSSLYRNPKEEQKGQADQRLQGTSGSVPSSSIEPEKAEPGATDNPDDAQRLREDH